MANKFPLILNTSANQIQEIASGDNLDLTGCGINNAGVITATSFSGNGAGLIGVASTDYIVTGTAATFTGGVDINSDLDVDGHTNLDNVSVAGVITATSFVGSGANLTGIDATSIKDSGGNVKVQAQASGAMHTGISTFGDIDVDGHTNLDNVNITGVSTFSAALDINAGVNISGLGDFAASTFNNIRLAYSGDSEIDTSSGNLILDSAGGTVQVTDNLSVTGSLTGTTATLSGALSGSTATFSGNVSVGGTLTYEDVTNVDAVGLITARGGINIQGSSTFTGNVLDFAEGKQLRFGTGNDFVILHSTNTLLENDTAGGNLTINNKSTSGKIYLNVSDGDNAVVATPDGSVEIHYANAKKIETTNTGAVITGICTATSFSGDGSALTGISAGPGTGQQYVNLESAGSASNTGNNTFAGYLSGNALNSADHSTFFGNQAGKASLNAGNNSFFGSNSGLLATGGDNSGFGQGTLETITSATSNVAVGRRALNTTTSSENVAVGADCLRYQTDGSKNTAVGRGAAEYLTTSSDNVAIGFQALRGTSSNAVTGLSNIAIGSAAGDALRAGSQNILIGQNAGGAMTGGHWNCIIGKDALQSGDCSGCVIIGLDAGTGANGSNNVFIGRGAADGSAADSDNCIVIGNNADPSSTTADNEITLGDANITKFRIPGIGLELTGPVGLTTEQVTPSSNVATLNLAKDDHKIVASGTYTVNVNGGSEAGSHTLRIENSGTANVGFSTYFKFPSGGTPSLPTASGAISLISFTVHKVGSVGIATVLLAGASVNYS